MASLDSSPQMVSAVRVAMSLPILLLAVPAGALADRVDRRRLLIVVQSGLMITAAALAASTYFGSITPGWLLILTVSMALGLVVHVPTWQASIPELVPREQIPQAVALGSVSFNLARSVGPALGGWLIAMCGSWVAFAFNAITFGVVIVALVAWRRADIDAAPREAYLASIKTGLVFALGQPVFRNVLIRTVLFVLPASALWSMMPLIARQQLQMDSRGYGLLVGAIGVGAVVAAIWLPRLRRIIGIDQTVFAGMCLFAAGLAVTSISTSRTAGLCSMFVMGIGWMVVLTTLNSTAQVTLSNPIRARGMACYLSAMGCGMAIGAWLWGTVASSYSLSLSLLAASALLPIHAVIGTMLPIEANGSRKSANPSS